MIMPLSIGLLGLLLPTLYGGPVSSLSFESSCSALPYQERKPWKPTSIINATYMAVNSIEFSNTSNYFAFCRLFATAPYPTENQVMFELWLPEPGNYNDRFTAVGDGGMAGAVEEIELLQSLNMGYAVVGGDGGHSAANNNGGNGEPGVYLPYLHDREQTLAWIHNSIAIMTPPAKTIVEEFYGRAPKYSYYQGCSTGGAQGFALAQFHPHLFDGIVAGSPGNWYSHLALSFLWNTVSEESPSFLSQNTLNLITEAVLDKCDTLDGVADRVIENPLLCHFEIETLACNSGGGDNSFCLTAAQLEEVKKIYSGPHNARSGPSLYPGFSLGSETEWIMQETVLADAFTIPILQNLVFDDLDYNASTFNWASDVNAVNMKAGTLIDEISPDLSSFRNRGGKMIVTQGWTDPYNAALWPIQHREQLQQAMGGERSVDQWFLLFMVPGGGHCGAASNYPQVPANWHSIEVLVDWVEKDEVPEQMLSTDPSEGSDTTRKLCPWPKNAKYIGGDVNSWTSYTCKMPHKEHN